MLLPGSPGGEALGQEQERSVPASVARANSTRSTTGDARTVADNHLAVLDDPHVDPSEVAMTKLRSGHELSGTRPKSSSKLVTAVVRLRGHGESRTAYADQTVRRQVLGGEIEVQEEIVAEKRERLAVGDQYRNIELYDRDLRVD